MSDHIDTQFHDPSFTPNEIIPTQTVEAANEQHERERIETRKCILEMQNFNRDFFPRVIVLVDHIGNGINGFLVTDEDKKEYTILVAEMATVTALQGEFFRSILHDPILSKRLSHDLSNGNAVMLADTLRRASNREVHYDNYAYFALFTVCYALHAGIIEALLLQKEAALAGCSEYFIAEADRQGFDEEMLYLALANFINNDTIKNLVKGGVDMSTLKENLLGEDEEVLANYGVIVRMVTNMIRNATEPAFGVSHIEVKKYREGSELVYDISDDACGIPPDMFDPTSKKFIYSTGPEKSGHESTGTGLAGVGEIAASMGIKVMVLSRLKKDAGDSIYVGTLAESDGSDNVRYTPLRQEVKDTQEPSTLFQIRLPIIKKI